MTEPSSTIAPGVPQAGVGGDGPVIPLRDLLPTIADDWGIDGGRGSALTLPRSERFVLVLVDGLGREPLDRLPQAAPTLTAALPTSHRLAAPRPTTTATSLTTLGTGLDPGQHGVVGYSFRHPVTGTIIRPLSWSPRIDPAQIQPFTPLLPRMAQAGVTVMSVVPPRHLGSGLSRAAWDSPQETGVEEADLDGWVTTIAAAARRGWRSFVYGYTRLLDHEGHHHGVASPQWVSALTTIDGQIARLRAALDDDVTLLVTGDHGMVDVPAPERIRIEDESDLIADVRIIAGEARFRHLHTSRPAAVARRWRDRIAHDGQVWTRREAIDSGVFGPVDRRVRGSLGDVIVAAGGGQAFLTRHQPGEASLEGFHGSLSLAETIVPLIVL
ncbi:MAG: alkaline phosphatase family protein [Propionibacteriaceae bacterium]|nr:alkaline phosphatase family protein [Propionibacteriaceae bacterium]